MEFTDFEVGTSITREGCRAQAAARLSHHTHEICVVLTGLALAAGILFAIHSPKASVMAGLTLLAAAYASLVVPITAARLYASRNESVNSILIVFGQENICVTTSVEKTRLEYDQIKHLEENSEFMILSLCHHTPLVFRKDEVLGGQVDALKAHLEGKTGFAFRSFKG